MKHYYESEILFKLMERDGFNVPSSVPPYESEIKAFLINQVKQAYPKLTDYEAEWLLYNYTKHLPADFPVSTITNATTAHFENVVPFAYQSAILTGQTLVNLLTQNSSTNMYTTRTQIDRGYRYTQQYSASMTATRLQWDITNNGLSRLKPNTKYYVQFTVKVNKSRGVRVSFEGGNEYATTLAENSTTTIRCSVLCGESLNRFFVYIYPPIDESYIGDTFDILDFMTIEYQESMENWDIPYFEGMQSVKSPVLTTTGKNLFDGKMEIGSIRNDGSLNGINITHRRSVNFISIEGNTTYTMSKEKADDGYIVIFEYDGNKKFIKYNAMGIKQTCIFTTNSNTRFVKFRYEKDADNNIQIEEGSVATTYEPYKSNILTVNEDVELRGIGDVKDELNLLTGEVTERIKEILNVEKGAWVLAGQTQSGLRTRFYIQVSDFKALSEIKSDKFNYIGRINSVTDVEGVGCHVGAKEIHLIIDNDKLSSLDLEGLDEFFKNNNTLIQYQLETPVVKTVDLTTTDENNETTYFIPIEGTMNVSSSSETIQPLFDMSVPVEATTQNLASFIELEMEE